MKDLFCELKTIYVVAPAGVASGGPELLHQLAAKLSGAGISIKMFYVPSNLTDPVHTNYKEYHLEYVRKIEDKGCNMIIAPETEVELLKSYLEIRKIIWWLSLDHYFLKLPGIKGRINNFVLHALKSQRYLFFDKRCVKDIVHFVQSRYAGEFLRKKGVSKIYYLSDYLHGSFFKYRVDIEKKRDIVVYNPKKGIKYTSKIMSYDENIKFVPIENMSRNEVVELLMVAKVYIDFGFHPGKDRIPREAAILKCCVITNRRGSANYREDVPISDKYKFAETKSNVAGIVSAIRDCFDNYESIVSEYSDYRKEIRSQESEFEKQIQYILNDLKVISKI